MLSEQIEEIRKDLIDKITLYDGSSKDVYYYNKRVKELEKLSFKELYFTAEEYTVLTLEMLERQLTSAAMEVSSLRATIKHITQQN